MLSSTEGEVTMTNEQAADLINVIMWIVIVLTALTFINDLRNL